MTTQEAIEYYEREIGRMQWLEAARDFAKTLLVREKELGQATRARDAAQTEHDKLVVAIADRKKRDAQAAAREREDLVRLMAKDQELAGRALAAARTELERVQAQTAAARAAQELAEGQRDAFRREADREAADLTARNTKLRAEYDANRERLTAALKV